MKGREWLGVKERKKTNNADSGYDDDNKTEWR